MRACLALLLVLVLPACSLVAGSVPDAANGDWVLTEATVAGEGELVLRRDAPITVTIDGEQISGSNSCNSYFGRIQTSARGVSITELGQTEMACPDLMGLEAIYMQALQAVTALEVAEDELRLRGDDVDLTFAQVEPLPTSDLTGTTWTLESLIEGDAVSSVGGEPATLELTEDGRITGSTGCRTFDGTYEVRGDTVMVTQLSTDDRACPADLQGQDDHVLEELGDGFLASIAENRLTVTSSGDQTRGLDYRG